MSTSSSTSISSPSAPTTDPTISVTNPSPEVSGTGPTAAPSTLPLSTTTSSSSKSSFSSSTATTGQHSRLNRPRLKSRKSSGTIIVPLDHVSVDTPGGEYPPDDARAMSPRRNSMEMEQLGKETRLAVQEQAKKLQNGLTEIAESIELVKQDHDKLERQNLALQDYIGGLTRSMSRNEIGAGKGKK